MQDMQNELWEEIAATMKEQGLNFRDVVFEIAQPLPSPEKELLLIRCLALRNKGGYKISDYYFPKFEELAGKVLASDTVSSADKNSIKGLYFRSFYEKQQWDDAEEAASELYLGEHLFPCELFLLLGEYYTHTRRYDRATELLNEGREMYPDADFYDAVRDCISRQTGVAKEYLPSAPERKEAYISFIMGLGISSAPTQKKATYDKVKPYTAPESESGTYSAPRVNIGTYIRSDDVIPDTDYPHFDIISGRYRSFVAYDIETTGFGLKTDCIVEIGAFRVVDGVIRNEERFRFQELMRPFGGVRGMNPQASEVTGITDDMLGSARTVREVFSDFADFIGDDILIGFNNQRFDAPRLRRAGRYAGRVITNPQLDVMLYARHKGISGKLVEIADRFGIENPNAHRAFADAWTTAALYLELIKL